MANARVAQARAEMFPSISLTAFLGSESAALANLFSGGQAATWQIAAGLTQPIFQGGRLQARRDAADARERAAVVQYQQAIRSAFGEVRTALITRPAPARATMPSRRAPPPLPRPCAWRGCATRTASRASST